MRYNKLLIIPLLFICGCYNAERTETKKTCESTSVQLVFAVEEVYDNYIESNKDVNQKELHLQLISAVDELARELIGKTGGVKRNGKELFNDCAPIKSLDYLFDDYKNKKILPLYTQLNESHKSKEIKEELEYFFYSDKPYFKKNYFQNKNISDITFDLMTLELILIN